jgi:uncharacterized membrane protein
MWLAFENVHGRRLWVAVGYYSPGCEDGSNWAKKGWWQLDPGQSATALWTTNRFAMFFAEDDVGAQWAGDRVTATPSSAFDWCWTTASTDSEDVGMRVLDSTNAWAPWVSTIKLS